MRTRLAVAVIAVLFAVIAARGQSQCIQASQHYEGHPKPNVYVVSVFSACDETRIVTVKIVDAIYGEPVREEKFPLDPGESRFVRIEYTGEKMFSFAVFSTPAD